MGGEERNDGKRRPAARKDDREALLGRVMTSQERQDTAPHDREKSGCADRSVRDGETVLEYPP